MFQVKIHAIVKIAGCPESGLPAIDFRRAHGLSDGPTNKFEAKYDATDEALCRRFPDLLTADGDLVITTGNGHVASQDLSSGVTSKARDLLRTFFVNYRDELANCYVGTDVLAAYSNYQGPATVAKLIDAMLAAGRAAREKEAAEKAERDAKEEARRRESEWAKVEYEAAKRAEELAKVERKAKREADLAAWAAAHGSDRLKKCVENGWECDAIYEDERLALEFPGWEWNDSSVPELDDPRNPPADAIALFDKAVATLPDDLRDTAELKFWKVKEEGEYDGEATVNTGYCVIADPGEWTNDSVVFGYDGPDVSDK